jgi:hypothetical protein
VSLVGAVLAGAFAVLVYEIGCEYCTQQPERFSTQLVIGIGTLAPAFAALYLAFAGDRRRTPWLLAAVWLAIAAWFVVATQADCPATSHPACNG